MHCFDFHRHHHIDVCFDHPLRKNVDPSINKDIYVSAETATISFTYMEAWVEYFQVSVFCGEKTF